MSLEIDRMLRDSRVAIAYCDGGGLRTVGKGQGLSHERVRTILQAKDIDRRKEGAPRKLRGDQLVQAIELYQQGRSTYSIAQVFELSPRTVRRALVRAGAAMRHSGWQIERGV